MTVKNLHAFLTRALKNGHARTRVVVNKASFTHPLEPDGCVLIDAHHVEITRVDLMNEDGGIAFDCRGQQRSFRALVIDGGNDPSITENLHKEIWLT